MGPSPSKEEKAIPTANGNDQDINTNLHILEIHMPTLGYGIGGLFVFVGGVFLTYKAYRRWIARKKRSIIRANGAEIRLRAMQHARQLLDDDAMETGSVTEDPLRSGRTRQASRSRSRTPRRSTASGHKY